MYESDVCHFQGEAVKSPGPSVSLLPALTLVKLNLICRVTAPCSKDVTVDIGEKVGLDFDVPLPSFLQLNGSLPNRVVQFRLRPQGRKSR